MVYTETSKFQSNSSKFCLNIDVKKLEVICLNTSHSQKMYSVARWLRHDRSKIIGILEELSVTTDDAAEENIKARLRKTRGAFINLKNIWNPIA